jgi:outer membrane protein
MKNFLLPLNIILLIAVGVLFYFQFSKKSTGAMANHKCDTTGKSGGARFAYFDLDSLQEHYQYAKEVQQSLVAKEDQMRKSLGSLSQQYTSLMKEYQQNGPSLSQTQQSDYQQRLMRLNTEYNQREQQFSQEMQSEAMRRQLLLKQTIQGVLNDYSRNHGYSFVLATSENDNLMYYRDSAFDVTNDVIKVLNEEYQKSKKK